MSNPSAKPNSAHQTQGEGREGVSAVLRGRTARELMQRNPVSIPSHYSVREAAAFLTDRGFSAAPVSNDAGRPVGVLSRADLVRHDREEVDYLQTGPDFYDVANLNSTERSDGLQIVRVDETKVEDIMTPMVISVSPETPSLEVVEKMLDSRIHRLFVVDEEGVLVGVISVLDLLRHLE